MMEQTYKIVGVQSENGYKKLKLKPLEKEVNEKKKLNVLGALNDINGFIGETKNMFTGSIHVDIICVPDAEYVKRGLVIDGMFTITY